MVDQGSDLSQRGDMGDPDEGVSGKAETLEVAVRKAYALSHSSAR